MQVGKGSEASLLGDGYRTLLHSHREPGIRITSDKWQEVIRMVGPESDTPGLARSELVRMLESAARMLKAGRVRYLHVVGSVEGERASHFPIRRVGGGAVVVPVKPPLLPSMLSSTTALAVASPRLASPPVDHARRPPCTRQQVAAATPVQQWRSANWDGSGRKSGAEGWCRSQIWASGILLLRI